MILAAGTRNLPGGTFREERMVIKTRQMKREEEGYIKKYALLPHKCDLCDRVMWLGYFFRRVHVYRNTSLRPKKEWRCPVCNPDWYKTGIGHNQ